MDQLTVHTHTYIYSIYLEGEEEVGEHGVDGAHGAERVQRVACLLARLRSGLVGWLVGFLGCIIVCVLKKI